MLNNNFIFSSRMSLFETFVCKENLSSLKRFSLLYGRFLSYYSVRGCTGNMTIDFGFGPYWKQRKYKNLWISRHQIVLRTSPVIRVFIGRGKVRKAVILFWHVDASERSNPIALQSNYKFSVYNRFWNNCILIKSIS